MGIENPAREINRLRLVRPLLEDRSGMRRLHALGLLVAAAAIFSAACGGPVVSDVGSTGGTDTSTPPGGTPPPGSFHAAGYAAATVHGLDAKMGVLACNTASCHGADLKGGGSGVSCDTCHTAGWTTNCVFCHGGTNEPSGAPPRDLDGNTSLTALTFPAHGPHATNSSGVHAAFDCTQCHAKPTDALTPGHMFDSTPGKAEVTFANGLSAGGAYDAATGKCSALYCHGNGQGNNGTATKTMAKPTCTSCHPNLGSSSTLIATMSGQHSRHLNGVGAKCYECHGKVVNSSNAILDVTLHVNGMKDNFFTGTNVTYNAATKKCNGTCHGKTHSGDGW